MRSIALVLVLGLGLASATEITCTGCYVGTSGVCKSKWGVCYELSKDTHACPPGAEPCKEETHYTCVNNTCSEAPNG